MKKNFFIPVLALLCGLSLGAGVFVMSSPTDNSDKAINAAAAAPELNTQAKAPNFPVNANGQTYGKDDPNISLTIEQEPDLIAALGNNGNVGYVYKTELYDLDNQPSCPEEALRMQAEREAAGNPPRTINVYESDGITVIDTFTMR